MNDRMTGNRKLFLSGMTLVWVLCLWVYGALSVEVGDVAPDFALQSTTGEIISLGQFRGKNSVLLEFYVADLGST